MRERRPRPPSKEASEGPPKERSQGRHMRGTHTEGRMDRQRVRVEGSEYGRSAGSISVRGNHVHHTGRGLGLEQWRLSAFIPFKPAISGGRQR